MSSSLEFQNYWSWYVLCHQKGVISAHVEQWLLGVVPGLTALAILGFC